MDWILLAWHLNKKSAQKQKRIRNNGFSQAVVP